MAPTREQHLESQSVSLQLRAKRSEGVMSELGEVSLRLFDRRGFATVTVEEIASEAEDIRATLYRCFAAKEDVLQLRIEIRFTAAQFKELYPHQISVKKWDAATAADVKQGCLLPAEAQTQTVSPHSPTWVAELPPPSGHLVLP